MESSSELRSARPGPRRSALLRGGLALALAVGAGCGAEPGTSEAEPAAAPDDGHDHHTHDHGEHASGLPTGAACPSDSALTYDGFGRPFLERYCVRCHAADLAGAARAGAPEGSDLDTRDGVLGSLADIDEAAAFGPFAENLHMPPDAPFPTEEERTRLGEWLACGARP